MLKKRESKELYIYIGIAVFSVVYLLFRSWNTSPLFNHKLNDSTIFRMMGIFTHEGLMPYVDFFDHKGPVLVLIEYLGACISHETIGNFIIELPFGFFTFAGIYNIIKVFVSGRAKYIYFAISILIYNLYMQSNLTEEYCLPFIIWCCYFALLYFQNRVEKHKLSWAFFYGIAIMVCILTRASNVIPIFSLLIVGLIVMIKKKDDILKNILCVLGGMIALAIPFIIYFAIKGHLYEMLYATIIFNLKYASTTTTHYELFFVIKLIFRKFVLIIFPIIISIVSLKMKKNKHISWAVIISCALGLILQVKIDLTFTPYLSVQFPMIVFAIFLLRDIYNSKRAKIITMPIIIFSSLIILVGNYLLLTDEIKVFKETGTAEYQSECRTVAKNIGKDKSKVIAYNVPSLFYVSTDIKPCYKYCIYQDWQTSKDENMFNEFANDIKSLKAEYIVEGSKAKNNLDEFINKNYSEIMRTKKLKLLKKNNK